MPFKNEYYYYRPRKVTASFSERYTDLLVVKCTWEAVASVLLTYYHLVYHNAIRARAEEVLPQMFKMRDDAID